MNAQQFTSPDCDQWCPLSQLPGTQLLPLAEPVPNGSIHRLRMAAGSHIPVHTHPCDEYVFVIAGQIKTGSYLCDAGTFWFTPANTPQGAHVALTDVELLTIRMGAMGGFDGTS